MGLDVELVRFEQEGTSPRRRRSADGPERQVIEAVRGLAERCRADRRLGLRLVGD